MLTAAALVFMAAGNGARANDGQRATTAAAADTTAADSAPPHRRTLGRRILGYIANANKPHPDRKFDFSILGGPHYNTNTKLGLGLVAAGLYNTDRSDSLMRTSNVSLFGDVSTVGFYMLGVRGLHIFPHDRYRLDYTLYFYSFPCKYWGMGYANGDNDDNESDMKRWQAQAKASFLFRVARNTYVGPMLTFDFIQGKDIKRPELLEGMDRTTRNVGVGLTFAYDSRDVTTNPKRGIYVSLSQNFRPAFLGNRYAFSTTDLRFNAELALEHGRVFLHLLLEILLRGHCRERVGIGLAQKLDAARIHESTERVEYLRSIEPELLHDGSRKGERAAERALALLDDLQEEGIHRKIALAGDLLHYRTVGEVVEVVVVLAYVEEAVGLQTPRLVYLKIQTNCFHILCFFIVNFKSASSTCSVPIRPPRTRP